MRPSASSQVMAAQVARLNVTLMDADLPSPTSANTVSAALLNPETADGFPQLPDSPLESPVREKAQ